MFEIPKLIASTPEPLLESVPEILGELDEIYAYYRQCLAHGAQMLETLTAKQGVAHLLAKGQSKRQAKALLGIAVDVALKAAEDHAKETGELPLVAGVLGPYGLQVAQKEYLLNKAQYLDFHLETLQTLLEQGPDCLGLVWQTKLSEPAAVLKWCTQNVPRLPVYVTLCLKDAKTLSDGTDLVEALNMLASFEQVVSLGIATCPENELLQAVKIFKATTALPVSVTNARKDLNELTKVLQKGVASLANPTLLRLQVAKKSPLKIRHDH